MKLKFKFLSIDFIDADLDRMTSGQRKAAKAIRNFFKFINSGNGC